MGANPVYNFIIRHAEEGIGVTFEAAVEYQCIYITMFSRKNMTKLRRIVTDDQFDLFLGATLEMMYEQLMGKEDKNGNSDSV